MLRYIHANQLTLFPKLQKTMFEDRAWQFSQRLRWDVKVDVTGAERDEYDDQNPLYAIWQNRDGSHGGSMRAMPTNAPCMINDHFAQVARERFDDQRVWESTRFCLSPNLGEAAARMSARLMLAGCEIGLGFDLTHAVGIFDARMIRIYRRLGWPPTVLGTDGVGRDKVYAGRWTFSEALCQRLAHVSGISPQVSRLWFQRAFKPADRLSA